jgi:hypothetical protein
MTEITNLIQKAVDHGRNTFYTNPDNTDPADALGIAISHWADWDGQKIVEVFKAALEDANFHTFNEQMSELWDDYKAEVEAEVNPFTT